VLQGKFSNSARWGAAFRSEVATVLGGPEDHVHVTGHDQADRLVETLARQRRESVPITQRRLEALARVSSIKPS